MFKRRIKEKVTQLCSRCKGPLEKERWRNIPTRWVCKKCKKIAKEELRKNRRAIALESVDDMI